MRRSRKINVVMAGAIVAVAFTAGLGDSLASNATGSSQTYFACLKAGALSKVGTTAPTCVSPAKQISWNSEGPTGNTGATGAIGATGADGANNYLLAQENGYQGTLTEWLASLVGPTGATGTAGPAGPTGPQGPVGPSPTTPIFITVGAGGTFSFQDGNLNLNVLCRTSGSQLQFTSEANGIIGWNYNTGPSSDVVGSGASGTGSTLGLASLPTAGQLFNFGDANGPIAGTFNFYDGQGNVDTFTLSAFTYTTGSNCQILGSETVAVGQ